MKKLVALVLALALCLSLCTVTAFADSMTIGGILATVENFPTTDDSSELPANPWVRVDKKATCYIYSTYICFNDGYKTLISLNANVSAYDDGYKYVEPDYNEYTIKFVMKDGVLEKIVFESPHSSQPKGTYTPPASEYTITVAECKNGSVTAKVNDAAATSAEQNNEVTIVATPDSGYELSTLTVTDADGNNVTVSENKFTMPNKAVTVSAKFTEIGGSDPDDDRDVDYEKLAKAGLVAAGVVTAVVVTKVVVDKLHEIKAEKAAAAEEAKLAEMPVVAMGSSSDAVTTLQTELNAQGYACGEADGVFGQNTLNAVKAFQTAKGLTADGIVGAQTWEALL